MTTAFPHRESPGAWHTQRIIRLGFYPKWRAEQRAGFRNFDPERIMRHCRAIGAGVLEWGVPENHIFIPWQGIAPHPGLQEYPGDLVADLCRAGRANDVKILLVVAPNTSHEDARAWRLADAETLALTGLGRDEAETTWCYHFCPHYQRHQDWMEGYLGALAGQYDIDGFMFDGPIWRHQHVWPRHEDGSIACRLCHDAYVRAAGRPLPRRRDWASPEFLAYVDYFNALYRDYLQRLADVVRAADPRLFVTFNSGVYVWGGWGDTIPWKGVDRAADSHIIEMHLAAGEELQPTLQLKLNRAALAGRPPEIYCKTYDLTVTNFAYSRPPSCEVEALARLALAEAGVIGIHSSMDENGHPHPERSAVFESVFAKILPRLEYYTRAEPVEHAGVHLGERTRDLYGGENPSQYLVSPIGMAQILSETHGTYGLVLDHDLRDADRLARFPLIVLANSACMSETQAEAVRRYVHAGGCLFATGETSLYDEDDGWRGDFLLADVLGVHYAGPSPKRDEVGRTPNFARYPFLLREHAITEGLQDSMITRLPWFDVEPDPGRDLLGAWADLRQETDFYCVNGGVEIIGDSGRPMAVCGTFGRGRVVYVSSDVSGTYMFEINRHIRALVRNALAWLAPEPVRVTAPKHVHFSITAQPHADRMVLHFVNILYNNRSAHEVLGHGFPYNPRAAERRLGIAPTLRSGREGAPVGLTAVIDAYRTRHCRYEADHTCASRDRAYPFDEVIPVHDVRVRIDAQAIPFTEAIDVDTGQSIPCQRRDNAVELVLPELQVYRGISLLRDRSRRSP